MADPSNGQMTIYSNDMKSYGLRNGVAEFLGMPRDQVRVVWMEGPQGYGRTAADDAGFEAAFLAKEIGRPVRVQWMRHEETAWDTKGPAFTFKMRGGLDAQGNLVAFDYNARAADYNHLGYNEPDTVLIAQLMGMRRATPAAGGAATPSDMYAIPNRRMATQVVSLPLVWETPLRTGNLRDPNGPQVTFAGESFIDELAAAAKADPVEFRLKLLTASTTDDSGFKRARSIAVVKAAAEAYGWDTRPSPKPLGTGNILTGRGIAYAFRSQTVVAEIAEVEVNRRTGHVWVKRLVCAHDCGLVINPEGLRRTIEGGMLHSLSRALHEEVQVRHRKGHERGLELSSHAHARRHAGQDRRRAGERRSQSEPARSSSLRSRRDGVQTDDRGGRQRHLRCDRRSSPSGSVQRRARARRAQGCTRVRLRLSRDNRHGRARRRAGIAIVQEEAELVVARGRRHRDRPGAGRHAVAHVGPAHVARVRRARCRERDPVTASPEAVGQRDRHRCAARDAGRADAKGRRSRRLHRHRRARGRARESAVEEQPELVGARSGRHRDRPRARRHARADEDPLEVARVWRASRRQCYPVRRRRQVHSPTSR